MQIYTRTDWASRQKAGLGHLNYRALIRSIFASLEELSFIMARVDSPHTVVTAAQLRIGHSSIATSFLLVLLEVRQLLLQFTLGVPLPCMHLHIMCTP